MLWPHGIAVLEPLAEPPGLLALHARLGEALLALGLQPEARAWDIASYALVESRAGLYTVLRDYPTS